jgi:hypothetical protein
MLKLLRSKRTLGRWHDSDISCVVVVYDNRVSVSIGRRRDIESLGTSFLGKLISRLRTYEMSTQELNVLWGLSLVNMCRTVTIHSYLTREANEEDEVA